MPSTRQKLIAITLLSLSTTLTAKAQSPNDGLNCTYQKSAVEFKDFIKQAKPGELTYCRSTLPAKAKENYKIKLIANGTCENDQACKVISVEDLSKTKNKIAKAEKPMSLSVVGIVTKNKSGDLTIALGDGVDNTFFIPSVHVIQITKQG